MKVVTETNKWKCPYCKTTVALEKDDIHTWNDVVYYQCPTCRRKPHLNTYNFSTWLFGGKRAIKVE